jgi:tetratricopeptide (TPR) repeat protein
MARFLLLAVVVAGGLCPSLGQSASDEMRAGVEAYKLALYDQAIVYFQKAAEMEPTLVIAHLYLAYAHAQEYIPGAESPSNLLRAERAIREFKLVLTQQPSIEQRVQSLQGLASLQYNMKQFDAARETYEELLKYDAENSETYYSLAVIGWTQTYTPRMELRASMHLKPTDEITTVSACALLRSMNQKKVEDGIQKLQKALELRCDYDDAMAYMNLLYREKAEYECDEPEQRAADLKTADEWVDRTIATKNAKAEKAAANSSQ